MASIRIPSLTDTTKIGSAVGKGFKLLGLGFLTFFLVWCAFNIAEWNDASNILIIQYPGGSFGVFTDPGPHPQWFGTIRVWPKRGSYKFERPIHFADRGDGTMFGSIQYQLPTNTNQVIALLKNYSTFDSIEEQLVRTSVNKAIYLTGGLMTSKESSAEKRNDLLRYIEDQLENGIYRTRAKETKIITPVSTVGSDPSDPKVKIQTEEKTIVIVEIMTDDKNLPIRQEKPVLPQWGIATSNLAIDNLPYGPEVEKQIKEQQRLTMAIQTSIAQAQQAVQEAVTAEANGKAKAAQARWKQEEIKATAVTLAEQERDVARLGKEKAEFYKQAQILEGEGEAAKKRLTMQADGALDKKLEAWKAVNGVYAEAIKFMKVPLVPSVVMGGDRGSSSSAKDFMDILTAKSLKELGLDMNMNKGQ